jgi:alpha-mannosidase
VAVLNPSPFSRAGLVDLDLAVPDDWDEVALELPDGRLVATQEAGRSPAVVHTEVVAGSRLAEVFRRVHGRTLYNRLINGIRVEGDGGHRLVLELDDHPDPPHLDMDELRAEVEAAAGAAPAASWEVRVVAPPRRRLQAAVPVPALGWTAVAASPGRGTLVWPVAPGRGRPGPDPARPPGPVVAGVGRLDNGLVSVEVAGDGTLRVRAGEMEVTGVGRLVDGGDAGDLYNYAPPRPGTWWSPSPSGSRWPPCRRAGPGRAGSCAAATAGRRPRSRRDRPLPEQAAVHTVMQASCGTGEPFLRLGVVVDNPCRDHRLRLHVPLAGPAERSSPRASSRWSSGAPRPRAGTARCRCPPSRPAGSSTPAGWPCSWTT